MGFSLLLLHRYLDKHNVVVTEAMMAELTASKGEWSSAELKRKNVYFLHDVAV